MLRRIIVAKVAYKGFSLQNPSSMFRSEQMKKRLERWRYALGRRGIKVNRSEAEYLCVNMRDRGNNEDSEVLKLDEF